MFIDITTERTETTEPTETTPAQPTSTARNSFGKRVSEDAKDGGVNGQEISKAAHERNEARKSGRATGAPVRTQHEADETEADETEHEKSDDSGRTSHESRSGESSKHGGSGDH